MDMLALLLAVSMIEWYIIDRAKSAIWDQLSFGKYITMAVVTFVCAVLAIRIKGKIIANWLVTIIRYNIRPRYYLFNKNTTALRENYSLVREAKATKKAKTKDRKRVALPKLDAMEAARILATIENPAARLQFETTKKGGLHVRLTEVEE